MISYNCSRRETNIRRSRDRDADLEILTCKVTPTIVTGARSPVTSAIVVGHRSQRKLLRHDVINSFVFRYDVLVKMGEDIRAAVNFGRRLVL